MIDILTWVSIGAGGILILMMLLSLIGGIDFDFDVDIGSADVDTDSSGGFGLLKGVLTFVSVSSWVIKILLATKSHPAFAISIGVICGIIAILLLNYIFRLLLKNEENVNYSLDDALFGTGTVYLKIPGSGGSGIVNIDVKGAVREIKAKSFANKDIPTGRAVRVMEVDGEYVIVDMIDNQ